MRMLTLRRHQRGAETIESALLLPIILLIFFAVVELSVAFFDQAILTGAARAGAREAIRNVSQSTLFLGYVGDSGAREAAESAAQRMFSWTGPQTLTVTTTPSDPAAVGSGEPIQVTLTYPYQFHILPNFMLGGLADITLSASTIMRKLPEAP